MNDHGPEVIVSELNPKKIENLVAKLNGNVKTVDYKVIFSCQDSSENKLL